ncbi:MAG TPA: TadE/TadG family type IV pilus assembly protein [Phenylobacterium sp.]|uniref:TadE/TadG family type IV pilus assembly protein n=1 Tax=Phenylobacterium sp. TaxID=1871053 RepID=UPI002B4A479D|nr:TadE/TadG family type IV pilus assembly protein [Phenylobacterium sp.]HKR90465.1 TadE/TadG family type IV pilus assembly protein [Phenylobacterium sp.]
MKKTFRLRRFLRDESGATAMEYGLVMPLLIMGILGAMWAGMLMFSASSLDLAVQAAARCMAVDANQCGSASATETYAQSQYSGPAISPAFTASASGCGHTVTGQATFDLGILPGVANVPLSSSACYP